MSVFVPTGIGTLLRLGGNFRLEIAAMKVLCHQNICKLLQVQYSSTGAVPTYLSSFLHGVCREYDNKRKRAVQIVNLTIWLPRPLFYCNRFTF